jgi:hypothetical protein
MDRSSFSKELQNRYTRTAKFFEAELSISFEDYLVTTNDFKKENRPANENPTREQQETSFDELRINKPEPSSITIVDICRQMQRQRFLIRPPYQRFEVKNRKKSSAIIESILLGIKLPPIFVYKREDGVSEVLDGQQRLLSILGFLKKEYLGEDNEKQVSNKNGYSLSLKNGILKKLDGKNVDSLDAELIKKINNFDLWIIEINHRYNKDFEPIDLFLRLNTKPYPIKDNTFELWNSYINKEIIGRIKMVLSENDNWFYFRKNNKRMENENIYTALVYLEHSRLLNNDIDHCLEYYKVAENINFRIRAKTEITKMLEANENKDSVIKACGKLKDEFIAKIRLLVSDSEESTVEILNKNLESIFNTSSSGKRTQQSFYALWYFMLNTSTTSVLKNKYEIRDNLSKLFKLMSQDTHKDIFTKSIEDFQIKFKD